MHEIKIGQRVAPKSVAKDSDDYDTGEVINVGAAFVTVRWELAEEVYDEDPDELVIIRNGAER